LPQADAVTFYTAANANFFLGLAGLVNSLRLVGHAEPVVVVDSGLADWQRTLLQDHVVLLEAPPGVSPDLCAWEGPRLRGSEDMVLIDADMVVTRHLGPAISSGGQSTAVVAFEDRLRERFFAEWSVDLELPPIVHRRPYANAGLLVFRSHRGKSVLDAIRDGQARMRLPRLAREPKAGWGRPGTRRVDPFYFRDQDVVNAVLMASLAPEELVVLDHRLAPFAVAARDLTVEDARALRCRYPDGVSPFVIHHTQKKPWLAPTPGNAYTELLGRLLLADDVAIRPPPEAVPLRFRSGWAAALERARVEVAAQLSARDQLRRLRRRLGPSEKTNADARAGSQNADTGDSEESLRVGGTAAPAQKQPGNDESRTGSKD
jgi:hypothetical protein